MFGFGSVFKIYSVVRRLQDAPQLLNKYAEYWMVHENGEVDGQVVKVVSGAVVSGNNPLLIETEFAFLDSSGTTHDAKGATAVRVPVIKKTIGEDGEYVQINGKRYENGTTGLKFGNMGLKITAKFTYRWTDENNVAHVGWFALKMPVTHFLG